MTVVHNLKKQQQSTANLTRTEYGHIDIVKVLLKSGANINAKGKVGETTLSIARSGGHTEVVQLLEEAGAK